MTIPMPDDRWYIEPPTENHYSECEDGESRYYFCDFHNLLIDGKEYLNWCRDCGSFIPHVQGCICLYIKDGVV